MANGNRALLLSKENMFSNVVSMEAVRLGFIMTHLNNLLVCAGDVGNAFLHGKSKKKCCIIAAPKFGLELEGKRLIIDGSLCGLASSAARFHKHLSIKMRPMGFKPSKADPDLWIFNLKDGT